MSYVPQSYQTTAIASSSAADSVRTCHAGHVNDALCLEPASPPGSTTYSGSVVLSRLAEQTAFQLRNPERGQRATSGYSGSDIWTSSGSHIRDNVLECSTPCSREVQDCTERYKDLYAIVSYGWWTLLVGGYTG